MRQFCLSHINHPFTQNWASSLKMVSRPKLGSTSNFSKTQSADTWHCQCPFGFSSWIIWILYMCRPNSRRKICYVVVCDKPSSCERRGTDCLGFCCTLSRTAACFSWSCVSLTLGCWLIVNWAGRLELLTIYTKRLKKRAPLLIFYLGSKRC